MAKVRVDFFKPSGKWYATEEVEWTGTGRDIHRAFAETLYTHLKSDSGLRFSDLLAVCLDPLHEFTHPLMMMVDRIYQLLNVDDSGKISDEHFESFDAFQGFNNS